MGAESGRIGSKTMRRLRVGSMEVLVGILLACAIFGDDAAECGPRQRGVVDRGHGVLWGVRAGASVPGARSSGQWVDCGVRVAGAVGALAAASSRGGGVGRGDRWGGVAGLRMRVGSGGAAIVRRKRCDGRGGPDVHAGRAGDQPGSAGRHRGGVSRCADDGCCPDGGVAADRGDHGLGVGAVGPPGVGHPPAAPPGRRHRVAVDGVR